MQDKIEDMQELGYSRGDVIKITKSLPGIYSRNIKNIQEKIEDIQKLGYSREDVIKMTKSLPAIYSLSIEYMQEKIEDMQKLGYRKEDVIKMTKNLPAIYGLSIKNMQEKLEDMQKLGYSKKDVIKMTKVSPSIYNYSIEKMQEKIEDMQKLGYSREDVIKMTKSLPTIYSYSIENMQQKIKFYDSINLHFLAVEDSKNLMQSTELSYARYMFYKQKGIAIDEQNYRRLFINQKQFENLYGFTKARILEDYLEGYPYTFMGDEAQTKENENTILPIQAAKSLINQDGVLEEIRTVDKIENKEMSTDEIIKEGELADD